MSASSPHISLDERIRPFIDGVDGESDDAIAALDELLRLLRSIGGQVKTMAPERWEERIERVARDWRLAERERTFARIEALEVSLREIAKRHNPDEAVPGCVCSGCFAHRALKEEE